MGTGVFAAKPVVLKPGPGMACLCKTGVITLRGVVVGTAFVNVEDKGRPAGTEEVIRVVLDGQDLVSKWGPEAVEILGSRESQETEILTKRTAERDKAEREVARLSKLVSLQERAIASLGINGHAAEDLLEIQERLYTLGRFLANENQDLVDAGILPKDAGRLSLLNALYEGFADVIPDLRNGADVLYQAAPNA